MLSNSWLPFRYMMKKTSRHQSTDYILSIYNIHRDPNFWGPDPNTFNPDRFLDRNLTRLKPCTFFPFSFGSRACIGKDFSLMATKIFLVKLLRMFDLSLVSNVPPKYTDYMSLRISSPIDCNLSKTKINFKRFRG